MELKRFPSEAVPFQGKRYTTLGNHHGEQGRLTDVPAQYIHRKEMRFFFASAPLLFPTRIPIVFSGDFITLYHDCGSVKGANSGEPTLDLLLRCVELPLGSTANLPLKGNENKGLFA